MIVSEIKWRCQMPPYVVKLDQHNRDRRDSRSMSGEDPVREHRCRVASSVDFGQAALLRHDARASWTEAVAWRQN